ncbi:MAG: pyridoxamine 5'-phosphate oxidase family protein [Dehalococcoidia bacterium]|nr:pyridoxamine 5'-phosphate oxidase family protein [Dehalococcoidia bacterium]
MPVQLTDEIKTTLNNARADGFPVLVASVDATGQPSVSIRGSLHVHSDNQLAIWIRNADGGILKSVAVNPLIAMWYRNTSSNVAYLIHGEAKRDDSEAIRQQVYDSSPEGERNMDPEKKGTALVIDVVRIIQRGQVLMER